MSAYLPLVQVIIRNEFNAVLKNKGQQSFQAIMGVGSTNSLVDMVHSQFNMSGSKLAGAKVGLLDPYQVRSCMVYPFKNSLYTPLAIKGSLESKHSDKAKLQQHALKLVVLQVHL